MSVSASFWRFSIDVFIHCIRSKHFSHIYILSCTSRRQCHVDRPETVAVHFCAKQRGELKETKNSVSRIYLLFTKMPTRTLLNLSESWKRVLSLSTEWPPCRCPYRRTVVPIWTRWHLDVLTSIPILWRTVTFLRRRVRCVASVGDFHHVCEVHPVRMSWQIRCLTRVSTKYKSKTGKFHL